MSQTGTAAPDRQEAHPPALAPERATHLPRRLQWAGRFLRRHFGELGLLYFGVLLPLLGLAWLARNVAGGATLPFDLPLLQAAQMLTTPAMDAVMLAVTEFGYGWGVVPLDVLIALGLLVFGRLSLALFFTLAVAGSALLNVATKLLFARSRPDLWESMVTETSYSFPSGHAMGSATLAFAVIAMLWHTRWRWVAVGTGGLAMLLIGGSRVYFGVHFPSDIVAGWAAAAAWVWGLHHVFGRRNRARSGAEGLGPRA